MFKKYLIFSAVVALAAARLDPNSTTDSTNTTESANATTTDSNSTLTTTTASSTTTVKRTHTLRPKPTSDKEDSDKSYENNRVYCSGKAYRKEIRHMKQDGDWEKFVIAFKKCGSDGTLDKYVGYYNTHWNYFNSHPRFHPWHRIMLKEFEKELMAHGAPYLPYWDWSVCYSQNPTDSPVLSDDYCGAPSNDAYRTVYNGPFSADKYTCKSDGKPLVRDYSAKKTSSFYHPALLNNILKQSTYSGFSSNVVYGPNAVVHEVLGGKQGQFCDHRSPYDPLFWMHSAFLDKMWDTYQSRGHQYDYEGSAYGVSCSSSDAIAPWNIPVKNVLKCSDICVSYVEMPSQYYASCPTVTAIVAPAAPTNYYKAAGCNDTIVVAAVNSTVDECASTVNSEISSGTPAPTSVYSATTNQQSASTGFNLLAQPIATMMVAAFGAAVVFF